MKINVSKVATLQGHRDCIYTLESSLEPNLVLSSGGDGMIAEWNLEDSEKGRLVAQVKGSVYALRRYDESRLIVGENGEGIHLIDLQEKQEIGSLMLPNKQIFDIQVSGGRALVATDDGSVYVIDLATLTVVSTLKHSTERARSIAINKELNEFVVGYSDHHFRVFDLLTGDLKYSHKGHDNSIFSLVFSPDSSRMLSVGRDAHIRVWNVGDGYTLEHEIPAHMFAINHLYFSPDGRHFVTCSMDKSIKVWDADSLKLLKVIDKARHAGHATSVNRLLWTNFSDLLVSGSDDRTLSVWEVEFDALS